MAEGKNHTVMAALARRGGTGLAVAGVISCFINLLQLLMPIYTLQVYDRVLNSRSTETLLMLTLLTVTGLGVMAALDYFRARIFQVLGAVVSRRLNAAALAAAVADSLRRRGASGAQSLRDLNEIRLFLTGPSVTLPLDLLWTPLFLAVLFLLHPAYGFIALGAAALLLALGVTVELVTRRPLAAANLAVAQSFSGAGMVVRNAEVVDAMGMLSAVSRQWQRNHGRALALLDHGSGRAKLITAISKSLRLALQVAMIGTGVLLVLDRTASPGSIITASILMGRLLLPFEQLIEGWRQWVFAFSAWGRVRRALTEAEDRRQTIDLPRPEGRLAVDRLSFLPPGSDKPVLKAISFALEPGEVLGVVGPSASGKSTLARLLVGVLEPTGGGAYLDGNNVFLWERDDFGRHVGYLPQSVALLDGTIRDNIGRMGEADPREVVAAARRADVHEMIGRMPRGYDTAIGEGGFALSGGQRQRIGLARAVFGSPRLVVLDEPNAHLDAEGEAALAEVVTQLKRDGTTVVLIAHRPSVMAVADKILVLREGTVERFGPAAEILQTVTGATVRPLRAGIPAGAR